MHAPVRTQPNKKKSAKAFWLKQLHSWHWVSSAISLIGLLLFAFTGITLNHAADVEGSPQTVTRSATLPPALLKQVAARQGVVSGQSVSVRLDLGGRRIIQ